MQDFEKGLIQVMGSLPTFGHCTYSGNITDVATLEGVIKQLAYFGCSKYVLVMDRGYWCVYNVSCLYNYNVDFLIHVKTSHNGYQDLCEHCLGSYEH